MSVKDGLLALLARGPSYGYRLRSDFEASTGGAWPLNIGQVYTSLQRLERDGLIEATPPAGDEQDRHAYACTAAGRENVRKWLTQPVARTVEDRDEVAMKILLAAATAPADALAVIEAQRDATMRTLQQHTRRKVRTTEASLADLVHVDRLVLACRAELDWLALAEERISRSGPASRRDSTAPTNTDDSHHEVAGGGSTA